MRAPSLLRVCGLGLAVLALPGCGKRGDPLPPLPRTPQPVGTLALAQRAGRLEVSLVAPRLTTAGVGLDVMEIELIRLDGPGDLLKEGRRQRYRLGPGEALRETFPLPPTGTTVKVAARAVHRGQPSAPSKVATLEVQSPPPAPSSLHAGLRPEGVLLGWTMALPPEVLAPHPPAALPEAMLKARQRLFDLLGVPTGGATAMPTRVHVYRRAPAGEHALLLPDAQAGTSLVDTGAEAGQSWCYVVRAVASLEPLVESADSPEACVEVKDVFPPAPPSGLAALALEGEVEVSWTPSEESDVMGYRLSRASAGAPAQRVAELPAEQTVYRDRPGSGEHVYTLTAFDRSGNESAPSAPATARQP